MRPPAAYIRSTPATRRVVSALPIPFIPDLTVASFWKDGTIFWRFLTFFVLLDLELEATAAYARALSTFLHPPSLLPLLPLPSFVPPPQNSSSPMGPCRL